MGSSYNQDLRRAWDEFCDDLKAAADIVFRPTAPDTDLDRATGIQYISRYITKALARELEYADPEFPQLRLLQTPTSKNFGDNPDCSYLVARIDGSHTYRIVGSRGTVHWVRFNVKGPDDNSFLADDDLEVEWDGSFVVTLSPEEHDGNWIRTSPGISQLMIRQFFGSWEGETPLTARIERVGGEGEFPSALTAERLVSSLTAAGQWLRGDSVRWPDYLDYFEEKGPNRFHAGSPQRALRSGVEESQRLSGRWVNFCRFELQSDEALLIEFTPPDCRFWTFELNNYWMMSVDYRYHLSSLNFHNAVAEDDGSYVVAVSDTDTGLANWLDPAGHGVGLIINRWVDAGEANPTPSTRVAKVADIQADFPHARRRSEAQRRDQLRALKVGVDRRFGPLGV